MKSSVERSVGTTRWTVGAVPAGIAMMLLGAWVFVVPLVGPYFAFGLFTSSPWVFLTVHWELLLGSGIAICVGGLLMTLPATPISSLGGVVSLVAGVWLLAGPSLYPVWASQPAIATSHPQWLLSLIWVGYFYGTGALAVYLSGGLHGMLVRRPVYHDQTMIEETPLEDRERVVAHL